MATTPTPPHVQDLLQQIKDNVAAKVAAITQPQANTPASENKGN